MLAPADESLVDPTDRTGESPARCSCRDAIRRRSERMASWIRSVARETPAWTRWTDAHPPRLAA